MKIAIVGLGYVGLPLSLQFARSGVEVLGLDIDPVKIEAISQGRSYIKHIEAARIAEPVKAGRFSASTDFSRVRETSANYPILRVIVRPGVVLFSVAPTANRV